MLILNIDQTNKVSVELWEEPKQSRIFPHLRDKEYEIKCNYLVYCLLLNVMYVRNILALTEKIRTTNTNLKENLIGI